MVPLCSLCFRANELPNFMNCTSQISAEPRHFAQCCCPCPCTNHHCASIRLRQLQSWVSCLQSCFLQSVLHTVPRLVFLNTDDFYISLLKTINMTLMLWGWNPNSLICLQNFPSSAVSCLTNGPCSLSTLAFHTPDFRQHFIHICILISNQNTYYTIKFSIQVYIFC